jgi:hypothetical protein
LAEIPDQTDDSTVNLRSLARGSGSKASICRHRNRLFWRSWTFAGYQHEASYFHGAGRVK